MKEDYKFSMQIFLQEVLELIKNKDKSFQYKDIDIYNLDDSLFIITKKNTKEIIGKIEFQNCNNIFYAIYEKYRRKGFGLMSVKGFIQYLSTMNVLYVRIICNKSNIPSYKIIKSIEKEYDKIDFFESNEFYGVKINIENELKKHSSIYSK